jgi:cobalt-precorrin 5A hydrolase / precorrin-3B C17-methyltransferase
VKVVTISVTEPGRAVAERLPYAHRHGEPAANLSQLWSEVDGFVLVLALGAAVRLIGPQLSGKDSDPAVVCVDDAGRFAISVVGGHASGANQLAETVAGLLGAEAVITTATDRLGLPALDQLEGLRAEGNIAAVTSALLRGAEVRLESDLAWPLPPALLHLLDSSSTNPVARVVVSDRVAPAGSGPEPTVVLRPRSLIAGIGTTTDATETDVVEALEVALERGGLSPAALSALATIDRRTEHPAIVAAAEHLGLTVVDFSAAELDRITVPTPSEVVRQAVGTASVAEAAALGAAGTGATLVVPKLVRGRVTVALARRCSPAGSLSIVGLGPGAPEHRTPAAEQAVRHAQVVVGFSSYVEQCADLLHPAQEIYRFDIGTELERARFALERAAQGQRVAVVCSGDAGIYAMASPVLELTETFADQGDPIPPITVVPGITAATGAASLLGAPLAHDHLVVSLSDLLTPWDLIADRVRAAAQTDLVLVVYNPRSARRRWQIEAARRILLEHRDAGTPVGIVTDAARPAQQVTLSTLGELDTSSVNMTTCLVIGSSQTRVVGGRMVTPRGYRQ